MKRLKFNMVEIALAIAVISIGLSAVLVLFPVGINAARAAMDENSYYDAAELIANFVRSELSKSSTSLIDSGEPVVPPTPTWSGAGAPFSEAVGGETAGLLKCGTKGVFRFVRLGNSGEEIFSADVRIWLVSGDLKDELYIPDMEDADRKPKLITALKDSEGNGLDTAFSTFAKSAKVEISWGENKRTFCVDVYNPYYTPGTP